MNLPVITFNDRILDLSPGTIIATTFQAFKIGELKTRSVAYTNRIKLPPTFNNQQTFENAQNVKSTTVRPYRRGTVKIEQEGISTLKNGYGLLKQSDDKYFYLEVYEGALGFFEAIKGRYVDAIDLGIYGPFDADFLDDNSATVNGGTPVIDYGRMLAIDQEIGNNLFDGDVFVPWFNPENGNIFFNIDYIPWINVSGTIGVTLLTSPTTNASTYLSQPYVFHRGLQYRVVIEVEVTSGATSGTIRVFGLSIESGTTEEIGNESIGSVGVHTLDATFTFPTSAAIIYDHIGIRATQNVGGATKDLILLSINVIPVHVIDIKPPYYLPVMGYMATIQAIVEQSGYTPDFDVSGVGDFLFDSLALAFGKSELKYNDRLLSKYNFRANASGTQQLTVNSSTAQKIEFPIVEFNGSEPWFNNLDEVNIPLLDFNLRFKLYCRLVVDVVVTGTGTFQFGLQDGVIDYDTQTFTTTGTYTIYLTTEIIQVGTGSTLDFQIDTERLSGTGSAAIDILSGYIYSFIDPTPVGAWHASNLVLPDMLQADLFADFLYRFGALVKEKDNVLTVRSIQNIILDRPSAPDWTTKRDTTKGESIAFLYNDYAQNNRFTDDPETMEDAVGIMAIDNENLNEQKTIYGSPFKAIEQINVEGIKVCRIPVFDFESDDPTKVSENFEAGPRLVYLRDDDNADPEVLYNTTTETVYRVAVYGDPTLYNGKSDRATWQYFINTYYAGLKTSLDTVKAVVRNYNLNVLDIHSLDLLTMILDDGVYYIVLRVADYIPGKTTKVELLKTNL